MVAASVLSYLQLLYGLKGRGSTCRLSVKISLLCRLSVKNFRPLSVVGKSQLIFLSLVSNFFLVLSVVSSIFYTSNYDDAQFAIFFALFAAQIRFSVHFGSFSRKNIISSSSITSMRNKTWEALRNKKTTWQLIMEKC